MIETDQFREILSRLQGVKRVGDTYMARCPAHDDRQPSLSIRLAENGNVLLKCFAGCPTESVLAAVGLNLSHLFAPSRNGKGHDRRPSEIVEVYPYHDEHNVPLYEVVRYAPKDFKQRRPDGKGGHLWNLDGVQRVLYRLPQLLNSREDDPDGLVFVCEGEKDANNLAALGLVATTNVGGAGKWKDGYSETLRGRRIVFLPDNDAAGRAHVQKAAASCFGKAQEIRIVDLPGVPPKGDVSDWIAAGGTAAALLDQVKSSPTWSPETTGSAASANPPLYGPIVVCLNSIAPRDVRWLWPGRIPAGRITLLVGRPGEGKSFITCALAACVSTEARGQTEVIVIAAQCSSSVPKMIPTTRSDRDWMRILLTARGFIFFRWSDVPPKKALRRRSCSRWRMWQLLKTRYGRYQTCG